MTLFGVHCHHHIISLKLKTLFNIKRNFSSENHRTPFQSSIHISFPCFSFSSHFDFLIKPISKSSQLHSLNKSSSSQKPINNNKFSPQVILLFVYFLTFLSFRLLSSILPSDFPNRWNNLIAFSEEAEIRVCDKYPSHLWQAIVASEDRRFFRHCGVDFIGVARAVSSWSSKGGGSTITQQLVKNTLLKNERTLSRKAVEMVLAILLERRISKWKVLASYMSKIYWGHGIYGIESAAYFYFGKHPSLLNLGESAMLAGIIPAPESRSPLRGVNRGKTFQVRALRRMVEVGFLDIQSALATVEEPLHLQVAVIGAGVSGLVASNLMSSKKVAVIGAGASGLVASRELRREGHVPVVFERNNNVGGTWIYNPEVESDLLGVDPSRTIVQSSVYDSLRTNLPRESMGFRDYPFVVIDEKKDTSGRRRDNRRFPGHREVLNYLQDFANDFELIELIRFETKVIHVGLLDDQEGEEEKKWRVKYKRKSSSSSTFVVDDEVFDAVVVCNGHFSEPLTAEIPGIDTWPGKQIHSHNYRVPELFRDQAVLLVGNSSSGEDLSRDVALVAKEVHIASKSLTNGTPTQQLGYDNIWLHSMIKSAHEDGTIVFQDGSSVLVNVILHCTGYKCTFPFLEINNIVTVDDNRVGPLYKHVFPPSLSPGLSFVGLLRKGIPFPGFELQSKWVAGVLSGRILLPSPEEMMLEVEDFYLKLEASGVPKRYTHNVLDCQFEYNNWLAGECGFPLSEEWRKQMFEAVVKKRKTNLEAYRDEWEDYKHLILQAHEDFRHHV